MKWSDLLKFLKVSIMQSFNTKQESIKKIQLDTEGWMERWRRWLILEPDLNILGFHSQTVSGLYLPLVKGFRESFSSHPLDHFAAVMWTHSLCHLFPWGVGEYFVMKGGSILLLMKQKTKSSLQLFITGHSEPFIIVSRWEAGVLCLIHVAASLWNYLLWYFLMPANNSNSCKHQTL